MYASICPVFYESRLDGLTKEKIHDFKIEYLVKDIDWSIAKSYIAMEGAYMFGGLTDTNVASDSLFLLKFGSTKQNRHIFVKP